MEASCSNVIAGAQAPGLRETGSCLLSRRRIQASVAALRTLHRVTRFQIAPSRSIGTGRGSETGCFSASEQLFFDFRVARAAAGGAGEAAQPHQNKGEGFSRGGVNGVKDERGNWVIG